MNGTCLFVQGAIRDFVDDKRKFVLCNCNAAKDSQGRCVGLQKFRRDEGAEMVNFLRLETKLELLHSQVKARLRRPALHCCKAVLRAEGILQCGAGRTLCLAEVPATGLHVRVHPMHELRIHSRHKTTIQVNMTTPDRRNACASQQVGKRQRFNFQATPTKFVP